MDYTILPVPLCPLKYSIYVTLTLTYYVISEHSTDEIIFKRVSLFITNKLEFFPPNISIHILVIHKISLDLKFSQVKVRVVRACVPTLQVVTQ